jgi:hypothetical protein
MSYTFIQHGNVILNLNNINLAKYTEINQELAVLIGSKEWTRLELQMAGIDDVVLFGKQADDIWEVIKNSSVSAETVEE